MFDIQVIFKKAASDKNMDFNDDFDKLKSILEYCNDEIKPVNKVQFRGGNKNFIEEIIARILIHFKEKGYVDENLKPIIDKYDNELRKITFLLVLNTDATFLYDLSKDNLICHCLNILPQLPKCLLIHLIWGLNLNKYFYEIIKFTPCWFSLQFINSSIDIIKYLKPYETLHTIEGILKSIFYNICRIEYRYIKETDKITISNKFYDNIIEILRQFYTPDIEKFNEWSKLKFYKYHGYSIKHFLDVILYCFNLYEYPIDCKLDNNYKIYDICLNVCPYIKIHTTSENKYSEFVKDHLKKIIIIMLNTLQYNVMLVTVSTFIYWNEIDLNDDENLQTAIGERSYNLIERIKNNKDFEHDIDQQLKSISIKPKTIEEKINDATIGDILRKIDDNNLEYDKKRIWFNELINRPVALASDECLESILSNSKMINVHNFMKLLEFLKDEYDNVEEQKNHEKNTVKEINDDDNNDDDDDDDNDSSMDYDAYENFDGILKILQESLKNFNTEELLIIILYRIKLFDKSSMINDKLSVRFEIMIEKNQEQQTLKYRSIEFFNKNLENFNEIHFLILCFENPEYIWKNFFNEACISEQQLKNFINISKITHKFSIIFIEKILNESFPHNCEEKYYSNFLYELYQTNLIDRDRFLKEFIYKNVTEMLELQQYIPLLKLFKCLIMIANKSQLSLNAPVLIMAGQVMDQLRWDMISYLDIKDEIIRICIEFIQIVSKKFLPVASERDKNWIKEKVKSYRPLTQYYFQKYTLKPEEKPKYFDKYLHPENFVDRNAIDEFLTSTYVRCTTKETEWLARNDELLPHISDVLIIIDGIVSELNNENAIANYRYCILNYINIIKKFLLPKLINDQLFGKDLIIKILKIIELSPKGIYDEIFMIFHEILFNICQKSSLIVKEENFINEMKKILNTMKDCKGKELFNEKFLAMITESSN